METKLHGVSYDHKKLKFHLFGAVDLWINLDTDELIVVDYKSTSKSTEVNIDADWQMSYKGRWNLPISFEKNGLVQILDILSMLMV